MPDSSANWLTLLNRRYEAVSAGMEPLLLTLIIFLPIAGAIGLLLVGQRSKLERALLRWGAFAVALVDLLISLWVVARFDLSRTADHHALFQ